MRIQSDDDDLTANLLVPAVEALKPGGAGQLVAAVIAGANADDARWLRDEVDSSLWQQSIASTDYEHACGRSDLSRLLEYGHPIPARRGRTAAFVAENYPGWTWNELIKVLRAAGVACGVPSRCDPAVGAIHFNHDGAWLVEWEGGRIMKSA